MSNFKFQKNLNIVGVYKFETVFLVTCASKCNIHKNNYEVLVDNIIR